MADALWLEGETVVQFEILSNCDLKKQQPVVKLPIGLVDQLRSYKKPIIECYRVLTLWTPRVYCKSPPTKPNCLRERQP